MFDFICKLKTTTRYCFGKKLVPSWDLRTHITRDLNYMKSLSLFPNINDDELDDIDFDKIQEYFESKDIPSSVFPPKKGVHGEMGILVSDVAINPSWFSGIGIAESMLNDLIERDKVEVNRTIKAEVVVSWDAAARYDMDKMNGNDVLLKLGPIVDNETIILHFHGGGFTGCNPGTFREMVGRVSKETLLRCVSAGYRKAPKYPFPAQLHDALISFLYLVKQGFEPKNIILFGDSAGAHTVLSLLFLLRQFDMHKVRGAIMLSPPSDIAVPQSPSIENNTRYDFMHFNPPEMPMSFSRLFYKPGTRCTPEYLEEIKDPFLSPIYGDFSDFPDTLIHVGGKEVLLDQAHELYEKIKAANPNRRIVLEEFEGAFHVHHQFPFVPKVDEAFAGIGAFTKSIQKE